MKSSTVPEIEVEVVGNERDERSRRTQAAAGGNGLAWWIARIMDELVVIPGVGVRVGLDPIVGLIPVVGDTASSALSALVLVRAAVTGVPRVVVARMAMNILINGVLGAIPVAGDFLSIWFKSNSRNRDLLEKHQGGGKNTKPDWIFVGTVLGVLALLLLGIAVLSVMVFVAFWKLLTQAAG